MFDLWAIMRRSDLLDLRAVVLDGQPRPVILLGAGASATSGVPLVRQLVDLIGRHAYCWKHRRDPADPILVRSDWFPWVRAFEWYENSYELQELYARHIQHLLVPRERRRQFFQQHVLVSPEAASSGYRALASLVGKRRIHSILTTNFDTLAFDSCKRDPSASSVVHIQSPADADLISTDPPVSQVVHVHGAVDHYSDLNLTEEVASLDAVFARQLIPLVADHPLIVIGYRGAEPSVYRDLLVAAASSARSPLPHGVFWCHRSRDGDLHPNVTDLSQRCGTNFALVEIEGFDELMAALDEDVPRLLTTRPAGPVVPFDAQPSEQRLLNGSAVDWDLVSHTLDIEALGRLALEVPGSGDDANLARLRVMELTSDASESEVLTNAGRLLFTSERPIRAVLSVRDGHHELAGNIFELFDSLTDLISASNEPYRLKGPESVEVRPYPPLAVKELLVNALAHRDYEIDAPIEVSLDENRLRIVNLGGLIDPDDIDGLGERPVRQYRNPRIAEVLYAAGLMDKYGSGLVDVRRWAREGGGVATFDVGSDNTQFEAVLTSRPDSHTGAATVVPAGAYEIFYLNALRVELPRHVWLGPTRAKRAHDIYSAHPGEPVPRFVLDGGNLLTFSNLTDANNPLREHVESPELHSVAETCQTAVGEGRIVELLNRMFERHMQAEGTEVHHRKQRVWFHLNPDGSDRVIEYKARMRTATRTVARGRKVDSRWAYFEHHAMAWSFIRIEDEWLLTVNPTWVFTRDGRGKLESRRRTTQLSTRKMANERNQAVLNHVFFWAWAICADNERAALDDGSESVWIARSPVSRHEIGVAPSLGSGEDDMPDPNDLEHVDEDELDDDAELMGFDDEVEHS